MKYQVKYSHALGNGLAGCLNAVIKLRRFEEPSPEEIAEQLGESSLGDINRFLQTWKLKAEFFRPKTGVGISVPIFLASELNDAQDVLACYDFFHFFNRGNLESKHFSLVSDYDPVKRIISLQDANLKTQEVIRDNAFIRGAMHKQEHGFYVIGRN